MNYEIISKICMSGVERQDALALIVGLQRNAVAAGVEAANITLIRVTESPDQPATDITSEAIAALQPPPPAPAPDPTPPPPTV